MSRPGRGKYLWQQLWGHLFLLPELDLSSWIHLDLDQQNPWHRARPLDSRGLHRFPRLEETSRAAPLQDAVAAPLVQLHWLCVCVCLDRTELPPFYPRRNNPFALQFYGPRHQAVWTCENEVAFNLTNTAEFPDKEGQRFSPPHNCHCLGAAFFQRPRGNSSS